ncbi:MAG: methyltransferase domain-containing protein [Parcubacteria group bacterium]|jgi:SAM-dependent methyltransferase
MLEKIRLLYEREQFNPSFVGLFINPFYFSRRGLHKNVSDLIVNLRGRVLDIGCGSKPYENLCVCDEYIGLDVEGRPNEKADYFYDCNKMPFGDASFDSLISSQVFEHVFNPGHFLKEANRVLKKDGIFLLTVPLVWEEHEKPYDFARYTSFGLKHILSEHGFEMLDSRKTSKGIETIFQLVTSYIYDVTLTKNNYLNVLITIILIAPVNIVGAILSKILPKNDNLYLDNVVIARKKISVSI